MALTDLKLALTMTATPEFPTPLLQQLYQSLPGEELPSMGGNSEGGKVGEME